MNFQSPPVCDLKTNRNEHHVINKDMAQEMLNAFCMPEAECVIKHGLTLRLKTSEFFPAPRAWTSFFVQTIEAASNQSQFIVKRCLGLLALLRGESINVGCLISENIKNMANAAKGACGHFCVINELCERAGIPTYPCDEMIGPKDPINVSMVKRLQHNHLAGETQPDQEDNQVGNKEELYQPHVQQ